MTETFLSTIIILLLAFQFYKERQFEKIIKEVLAAKIAKDAFEFKSLSSENVSSVTPQKTKLEPEEIPIEEAPPEKLLEALGYNKK